MGRGGVRQPSGPPRARRLLRPHQGLGYSGPGCAACLRDVVGGRAAGLPRCRGRAWTAGRAVRLAPGAAGLAARAGGAASGRAVDHAVLRAAGDGERLVGAERAGRGRLLRAVRRGVRRPGSADRPRGRHRVDDAGPAERRGVPVRSADAGGPGSAAMEGAHRGGGRPGGRVAGVGDRGRTAVRRAAVPAAPGRRATGRVRVPSRLRLRMARTQRSDGPAGLPAEKLVHANSRGYLARRVVAGTAGTGGAWRAGRPSCRPGSGRR